MEKENNLRSNDVFQNSFAQEQEMQETSSLSAVPYQLQTSDNSNASNKPAANLTPTRSFPSPTYQLKESHEESSELTEAPAAVQLQTDGGGDEGDNGGGDGSGPSGSGSGDLPNDLKSGIESLSGMAMDDVKVNYNSSKPAQLNAHAYAQGSNIEVGPGQEKHLPHEAWHVVQQKQGRVKPTTQLKGKAINDNDALEKEADVMGAKALRDSSSSASAGTSGSMLNSSSMSTTMLKRVPMSSRTPFQLKVKKVTDGTDYVVKTKASLKKNDATKEDLKEMNPGDVVKGTNDKQQKIFFSNPLLTDKEVVHVGSGKSGIVTKSAISVKTKYNLPPNLLGKEGISITETNSKKKSTAPAVSLAANGPGAKIDKGDSLKVDGTQYNLDETGQQLLPVVHEIPTTSNIAAKVDLIDRTPMQDENKHSDGYITSKSVLHKAKNADQIKSVNAKDATETLDVGDKVNSTGKTYLGITNSGKTNLNPVEFNGLKGYTESKILASPGFNNNTQNRFKNAIVKKAIPFYEAKDPDPSRSKSFHAKDSSLTLEVGTRLNSDFEEEGVNHMNPDGTAPILLAKVKLFDGDKIGYIPKNTGVLEKIQNSATDQYASPTSEGSKTLDAPVFKDAFIVSRTYLFKPKEESRQTTIATSEDKYIDTEEEKIMEVGDRIKVSYDNFGINKLGHKVIMVQISGSTDYFYVLHDKVSSKSANITGDIQDSKSTDLATEVMMDVVNARIGTLERESEALDERIQNTPHETSKRIASKKKRDVDSTKNALTSKKTATNGKSVESILVVSLPGTMLDDQGKKVGRLLYPGDKLFKISGVTDKLLDPITGIQGVFDNVKPIDQFIKSNTASFTSAIITSTTKLYTLKDASGIYSLGTKEHTATKLKAGDTDYEVDLNYEGYNDKGRRLVKIKHNTNGQEFFARKDKITLASDYSNGVVGSGGFEPAISIKQEGMREAGSSGKTLGKYIGQVLIKNQNLDADYSDQRLDSKGKVHIKIKYKGKEGYVNQNAIVLKEHYEHSDYIDKDAGLGTGKHNGYTQTSTILHPPSSIATSNNVVTNRRVRGTKRIQAGTKLLLDFSDIRSALDKQRYIKADYNGNVGYVPISSINPLQRLQDDVLNGSYTDGIIITKAELYAADTTTDSIKINKTNKVLATPGLPVRVDFKEFRISVQGRRRRKTTSAYVRVTNYVDENGATINDRYISVLAIQDNKNANQKTLNTGGSVERDSALASGSLAPTSPGGQAISVKYVKSYMAQPSKFFAVDMSTAVDHIKIETAAVNLNETTGTPPGFALPHNTSRELKTGAKIEVDYGATYVSHEGTPVYRIKRGTEEGYIAKAAVAEENMSESTSSTGPPSFKSARVIANAHLHSSVANSVLSETKGIKGVRNRIGAKLVPGAEIQIDENNFGINKNGQKMVFAKINSTTTGFIRLSKIKKDVEDPTNDFVPTIVTKKMRLRNDSNKKIGKTIAPGETLMVNFGAAAPAALANDKWVEVQNEEDPTVKHYARARKLMVNTAYEKLLSKGKPAKAGMAEASTIEAGDVSSVLGDIGGISGEFGDAVKGDFKAEKYGTSLGSDTQDKITGGLGVASAGLGTIAGIAGMVQSFQDVFAATTPMERIEGVMNIVDGFGSTSSSIIGLTTGAMDLAKFGDSAKTGLAADYGAGIASSITAVKNAALAIIGIVRVAKSKSSNKGEQQAANLLLLAEAIAEGAKAADTFLKIKDGTPAGPLSDKVLPGIGIAVSAASLILNLYKGGKAAGYKNELIDMDMEDKEGIGGKHDERVARTQDRGSLLRTAIREQLQKDNTGMLSDRFVKEQLFIDDKRGVLGARKTYKRVHPKMLFYIENKKFKRDLVSGKAVEENEENIITVKVKGKDIKLTSKAISLIKEYELASKLQEINQKRQVKANSEAMKALLGMTAEILNLSGVAAIAGSSIKAAISAKGVINTISKGIQTQHRNAQGAKIQHEQSLGFDTSERSDRSNERKHQESVQHTKTILKFIAGLPTAEKMKETLNPPSTAPMLSDDEKKAKKIEWAVRYRKAGKYLKFTGVDLGKLYSKNGDVPSQAGMIIEALKKRD